MTSRRCVSALLVTSGLLAALGCAPKTMSSGETVEIPFGWAPGMRLEYKTTQAVTLLGYGPSPLTQQQIITQTMLIGTGPDDSLEVRFEQDGQEIYVPIRLSRSGTYLGITPNPEKEVSKEVAKTIQDTMEVALQFLGSWRVGERRLLKPVVVRVAEGSASAKTYATFRKRTVQLEREAAEFQVEVEMYVSTTSPGAPSRTS